MVWSRRWILNKLFKRFLKINNIKCIQHTMKESLLFLRDLLEIWRTRFLSTWQLFQRMFSFMCQTILLINTITQFIEALKWNYLTLHLILMLNKTKILMKKDLDSKLVIVSKFQNTNIFLLKDTLKTGRKKFLLLVKLKIQFLWHTWLMT